MGKKYVNTGNSVISFGGDDVVSQGKTIELSEELQKERADAIETLIAEGKLTESSKVGKELEEKPKVPEKEKEEKPKDKK